MIKKVNNKNREEENDNKNREEEENYIIKDDNIEYNEGDNKKVRIRKTCNRCRALGYGIIHRHCWECSLGYDIDSQRAIPREICPKPMTIDKLVKLDRMRISKCVIE